MRHLRYIRRIWKRLDAALKRLPEDYEPWGQNERWKDPHLAYPDCSGGCKWFIPLEGRLGMDYGVCMNQKSHRCGLLTFEHQGCQHYEYRTKKADERYEREINGE